MASEKPVTTEEAAEFLGIGPATMTNWRVVRRGPPFLKMGGLIRYERSALEAWRESCRVPTEPNGRKPLKLAGS